MSRILTVIFLLFAGVTANSLRIEDEMNMDSVEAVPDEMEADAEMEVSVRWIRFAVWSPPGFLDEAGCQHIILIYLYRLNRTQVSVISTVGKISITTTVMTIAIAGMSSRPSKTSLIAAWTKTVGALVIGVDLPVALLPVMEASVRRNIGGAAITNIADMTKTFRPKLTTRSNVATSTNWSKLSSEKISDMTKSWVNSLGDNSWLISLPRGVKERNFALRLRIPIVWPAYGKVWCSLVSKQLSD